MRHRQYTIFLHNEIVFTIPAVFIEKYDDAVSFLFFFRAPAPCWRWERHAIWLLRAHAACACAARRVRGSILTAPQPRSVDIYSFRYMMIWSSSWRDDMRETRYGTRFDDERLLVVSLFLRLVYHIAVTILRYDIDIWEYLPLPLYTCFLARFMSVRYDTSRCAKSNQRQKASSFSE